MRKEDTGDLGQDVVERLEQMLDLTKEIEDGKAEYRMVTSYLNDIEMLAELPEDEHKQLEEIAVNVVQLNASRTEFLNSVKSFPTRSLPDAKRSRRSRGRSSVFPQTRFTGYFRGGI